MRVAHLPALAAILFVGTSCRTAARLAPGPARGPVVVWQPSHQTDTGKDFNEAEVNNGIADAAMRTKPRLNEHKVWSLGVAGLHHANTGSNTMLAHTTALVDGQLSGYAYELKESNALAPTVFVALHNNGGTNRHAIWGYIHDGDAMEADNRVLAARLVAAVAAVTGLEDRGVLLDSSTGRNDYRCAVTGRLGFYSLDENVNRAPYRVLLEIGDNTVSRALLQDPAQQRAMGRAIKKALGAWLAEHRGALAPVRPAP
ncbi:MAG: N-acetylmuramoyl-L-alanine amidase [Gemmatimonadota bacterium]|nr:N-acetylmuramoyl-L-alanine amidase [Gemmatimonadota bacterium]